MLPSYAESVTCVVWQLDLKNTSVHQSCGKNPHFGFPTLATLLYKKLLKATSKGQAHIFLCQSLDLSYVVCFPSCEKNSAIVI